jgi:hypothetical protein
MKTNARMKTHSLVLVSVRPIGLEGSAPRGGWNRVVETFGRIRLLAASPVASWHWAMAKRRARLEATREARHEADVAETRALPVIPGG